MERAKAINLVRKLRTLAASEERLGNVAAGNAARVKAAELRDKYGISAAELDGGPVTANPPSQARRNGAGVVVGNYTVEWDSKSMTINGQQFTEEDLRELGIRMGANMVADVLRSIFQ
jgi:hypothetical protein